tara:strand:- start:20120 stop:20629 length:510 start_codon:yes stop_codon:yes gene_type:complete
MKNNWLVPDWDAGITIQEIPLNHLLNRNIKAILLDVDGTLLPRDEINLSTSVKNWIKEAKKELLIYLLSNNPSKKRIGFIANQLNIGYVSSALKPRLKATNKVIKSLKLKNSDIAILGDRIFTDILVGNRLGIYTILVNPVNKDGIKERKNTLQKFEKSIAKFIGGNML